MNNPSFVFFGTSRFAVLVLETLKKEGVIPSLIVTTPDKPQGRKLIITPPPAKIWAQENNIPILQPEKLDSDFVYSLGSRVCDLFLVASYGKIIPETVLDLMPHKVLNIHPSLLPKLRGASPLQSAILGETETGVSIMELDKEMDHGPIVAQEKVDVSPWPPRVDTLEEILAEAGAKLLAKILPEWLEEKVKPQEQAHGKATYTKKIEKTDGLIDLAGDPYENFKKIQAYHGWPTAYFFAEKGDKKIRVIVKEAKFEDGKLEILKVLPEGKKEISYSQFLTQN